MNKADRRFQERSQRNALQDREASRQKMLEKVGLRPEPQSPEDILKIVTELSEQVATIYKTFGNALAEFGTAFAEYARKARMLDRLYTEEYEDEYDEMFADLEEMTDEDREAECVLAP